MNDKRINLIRECEWEEVFLEWYKSEGENSGWIQLAQERGVASWAEWRLKGYAKRFECAQAKWGFYEVDPAVILDWHGGPFRTWIEKYYGNQHTKTFAELAEKTDVLDNPSVKAIMENYPKNSIVSALELNDGRIFVIEGMHRTCSLACMIKQGKPLPNKLIFAIGKSDLAELSTAGQNTFNK
ncbi:MAG: hypothetical protein ABIA02_00325 [Candidatus Falkowbacteria bacterium]